MEYINGLLPGEKIDTKLILQRLSEYGICLLSGETADLTLVPVDFDLQNYLASNMAQISKSLAENHSMIYTYEQAYGPFCVEFESSEIFEDYNRQIIKLHSGSAAMDESTTLNSIGLRLYDVFKDLTSKHVKGIHRIRHDVTKTSLNKYSYQNYVVRELSKVPQQTVSLIRP
jgi:hypothetical protein